MKVLISENGHGFIVVDNTVLEIRGNFCKTLPDEKDCVEVWAVSTTAALMLRRFHKEHYGEHCTKANQYIRDIKDELEGLGEFAPITPDQTDTPLAAQEAKPGPHYCAITKTCDKPGRESLVRAPECYADCPDRTGREEGE